MPEIELLAALKVLCLVAGLCFGVTVVFSFLPKRFK